MRPRRCLSRLARDRPNREERVPRHRDKDASSLSLPDGPRVSPPMVGGNYPTVMVTVAVADFGFRESSLSVMVYWKLSVPVKPAFGV